MAFSVLMNILLHLLNATNMERTVKPLTYDQGQVADRQTDHTDFLFRQLERKSVWTEEFIVTTLVRDSTVGTGQFVSNSCHPTSIAWPIREDPHDNMSHDQPIMLIFHEFSDQILKHCLQLWLTMSKKIQCICFYVSIFSRQLLNCYNNNYLHHWWLRTGLPVFYQKPWITSIYLLYVKAATKIYKM